MGRRGEELQIDNRVLRAAGILRFPALGASTFTCGRLGPTYFFWYRELNLGVCACWASTLPLRYIPPLSLIFVLINY